jgi:hypothetical protein
MNGKENYREFPHTQGKLCKGITLSLTSRKSYYIEVELLPHHAKKILQNWIGLISLHPEKTA